MWLNVNVAHGVVPKLNKPAQTLIDPRQRRARSLKSVEREIERLAVMCGEQEVPDFPAGESFCQEIAHGEEVA